MTKGKLLKAALRIFTRDGFEAARIEDIAAEAGYTRGAFYAHFQTKEDLFFAMLEAESERHMEHVKANIEVCKNDQERINVLREYYATRLADRQWAILVTEFKLFALRRSRMRAKLAEMHRSIRTKIKLKGLERLWPQAVRCTDHEFLLRRVALEIMKNGLALEHAYDPAAVSETQAKFLLRQLFDFLVEAPSTHPHGL
ncbi:MAG: TetR/AcrR family transcriptional regulator [Acidobacteriaceae bacterium]|nr:TetR/AcrR family transcriptional regulator [Acidobacteriaceae bacterium]